MFKKKKVKVFSIFSKQLKFHFFIFDEKIKSESMYFDRRKKSRDTKRTLPHILARSAVSSFAFINLDY